MATASVGDLLALDELLASMPDLQRASVERAIDARRGIPHAAADAAVRESYDLGYRDGKRDGKAQSKAVDAKATGAGD